MLYPVLIEQGSETTAFGIVVPDLPGCFSAADTQDHALAAAAEAAAVWIEAARRRGESVPAPSDMADVRGLPDYEGWRVAVIDLP